MDKSPSIFFMRLNLLIKNEGQCPEYIWRCKMKFSEMFFLQEGFSLKKMNGNVLIQLKKKSSNNIGDGLQLATHQHFPIQL